MASESAPRKGTSEHGNQERRGEIILFPDRRTFGPLSWRTVRIASMVILALVLAGALIQMFLWRTLRDAHPASPSASRLPS